MARTKERGSYLGEQPQAEDDISPPCGQGVLRGGHCDTLIAVEGGDQGANNSVEAIAMRGKKKLFKKKSQGDLGFLWSGLVILWAFIHRVNKM